MVSSLAVGLPFLYTFLDEILASFSGKRKVRVLNDRGRLLKIKAGLLENKDWLLKSLVTGHKGTRTMHSDGDAAHNLCRSHVHRPRVQKRY